MQAGWILREQPNAFAEGVFHADPERYPAVARVIAAGVFDDDATPPGQGEEDFPDDEYSFGLERILDGLDALDRSRRNAAPG